jgi:hypothetical protein
MASRRPRDAYDEFSPPKRRKNQHRVSESEEDSGSDGESARDQYHDPNDFLRNFGGYESDGTDVDEGKETETTKMLECDREI